MNYQKIQPYSLLTPFVESIWVQESDVPAEGSPTVILPTATMDLVFYFGDPFVEINESGCQQLLPRIHIAAQKTKPVKVLATGRTGIIIVSFKPWGFYHLFGIPADEVKNSSVALNDLVEKNLDEHLLEELHVQSTDRRVEFVKSFLCSFIEEKYQDDLVIQAALYINNTKGTLPISQVIDQFFISKRQFIRRFKKVIGLTPKQFSDIIRFQKALFCTKVGVPSDKILEMFGYYDQAHLIKEFNKYSGFTPQRILRENALSPLKEHFNAKSNMSLFYNTIYL